MTKHWSDCAVNSEPAYPAGECDCGGFKQYQDEGMCQACEFGQCTAKAGCVAISNPPPKQEQGEPVAKNYIGEPWDYKPEANKKTKQRPFTKQQRDLICMIYDIATGSTTINSLPHIAKLANQLLTEDVYAQPKQEQGEPVAFKDSNGNIRMTVDASAPIVMTPHPSFAQQRKPLTDEQVEALWHEDTSCDAPATLSEFKHTIRVAEAAHDIKAQA